MTRAAALDRLLEAAQEQGGYVTAAQAAALGIRRERLPDLVRTGDLRRVRRGVYAMRGVAHPFEQEIAAWLSVDRRRVPWRWDESATPEAVISHESAAAVWGLGTIVPTLPSVTVGRNASRGREIAVHRAALRPGDWQWHRLSDGLLVPVTTPARTIVDLLIVGVEPTYLRRAWEEARARAIISREAIIEAARHRRARASGLVARVERLLDDS